MFEDMFGRKIRKDGSFDTSRGEETKGKEFDYKIEGSSDKASQGVESDLTPTTPLTPNPYSTEKSESIYTTMGQRDLNVVEESGESSIKEDEFIDIGDYLNTPMSEAEEAGNEDNFKKRA